MSKLKGENLFEGFKNKSEELLTLKEQDEDWKPEPIHRKRGRPKKTETYDITYNIRKDATAIIEADLDMSKLTLFKKYVFPQELEKSLITRKTINFTLACKLCKFVTEKLTAMDEHNIRHEKIAEMRKGFYFFCEFCKMGFANKDEKQKHRQTVHTEMMQCVQCPNKYPQHELHKHYTYKHSNEIYRLTFDHPNAAPWGQNVLKHQEILKPYSGEQICAVCGSKSKSVHTLLVHYRINGPGHKAQCVQCSEPFRTWQQHKDHVLLRHDNVWKYRCSNKFCLEESTLFNSKDEVVEHVKEKHKAGLIATLNQEVACDICGFVTAKGQMGKHKMKKHRVAKKNIINCKHCTATYTTEYGLNMHMEDLHSEKTCDVCGFVVQSGKCGLRQHKVTAHNVGGKFGCEICGKRFVQEKKFECHMNYHNGVKPFKCQHCDMAFSDDSNMRAHIKMVHLGIKRIFNKRNEL